MWCQMIKVGVFLRKPQQPDRSKQAGRLEIMSKARSDKSGVTVQSESESGGHWAQGSFLVVPPKASTQATQGRPHHSVNRQPS